MNRIKHSFLALIRALDLLICTIWLGTLYPFYLADKPTGRHMISSYVGKAAKNGTRWGIRAARWIDWLAELLGDEPNHCARAYEFYKRLEI